MHWDEICEMRRWMPIGRRSDPKAPAAGYATDMPDGGTNARGHETKPWLTWDEITTPLAGLNFGPRDGLLGIDLDFKPAEAADDETVARAKKRLGEVRAGLQGCGLAAEISHSGLGVHLFGWMGDGLREAMGNNARIPVVLERGVKKKAVAAVELFGAGNAYIAVSNRWVHGKRPEVLPTVGLEMLQQILPEWQVTGGLAPPPAPPPRREPERQDGAERMLTILRRTPVPADYDDWLKAVSAALAAGIAPDDIEAWCATGPKYRAGEVYEKVGHEMKTVSAGWLVSYARAQGVEIPYAGGKRHAGSKGAASSPVYPEDEMKARGAALANAWERAQAAVPESAYPVLTPPAPAPATQDGKYFTTAQSCTCPDYKYRPENRPCKHIKELVGTEEEMPPLPDGYDPANRPPWCHDCVPMAHFHRVGEGDCVPVEVAA